MLGSLSLLRVPLCLCGSGLVQNAASYRCSKSVSVTGRGLSVPVHCCEASSASTGKMPPADAALRQPASAGPARCIKLGDAPGQRLAGRHGVAVDQPDVVGQVAVQRRRRRRR